MTHEHFVHEALQHPIATQVGYATPTAQLKLHTVLVAVVYRADAADKLRSQQKHYMR
jgi:hypothetical protein